MTRHLIVSIAGLAILFPASGYAQAPDSLDSASPETVFRLDLVAIGLATGFAGGVAVGEGLSSIGVEDGVRVPALLVAYPFGVAFGVCEMGRERKIEGTCRGALRGALRGVLVGYGAAAIVMVVATGSSGGFDALARGVFVGSLVGLAGPAVGASLGYSVVPATVRQTDGAANGVAVRIAL